MSECKRSRASRKNDVMTNNEGGVVQVSESPTPEIVYHYTSKKVFGQILEGMHLRFGHIRPQNDKEEVTYYQDICYDFLKTECAKSNADAQLRILCQPMLFDVRGPEQPRDDIPIGRQSYIVSFSADGDSKSQWGQYASDFEGIAIGFRTTDFIKRGFERLNSTLGNDVGLFEHVSYAKPDAIKTELLPSLMSDPISWFKGNYVLQHFHKSWVWHEEQEWRLYLSPTDGVPINPQEGLIRSHMVWRDNEPTRYSGLQRLPFLKFDAGAIGEIVLGPKCNLQEIELKQQLQERGIVGPIIRRSSLRIR